MTVCLHTCMRIHDVQEEFSRIFPGLKIEFVFHGDEKLNLSSHFDHTFYYTPVNEIFPDCIINDLVITETMTTKEVEELFERNWNLPAQIYVNIDGYWQKNRRTENTRLKNFSKQPHN